MERDVPNGIKIRLERGEVGRVKKYLINLCIVIR